MSCVWFGLDSGLLHVRTGDEPINLAQASSSHLSESSRKLTQVSAWVVAQAMSSSLSESDLAQVGRSRLSENLQNLTVLHVCNLSQARAFSMSERLMLLEWELFSLSEINNIIVLIAWLLPWLIDLLLKA